MEGCPNRGWISVLPVLPALYAPQPSSDRRVGLGFPHRAGRCRIGSTRFSFPGCRSCRYMEGCLNRGRIYTFPRLSFLYAPQPINDRPVGFGFPHRAGRCRPARTQWSSPWCRSCRCMEAFPNRGWGPFLPVLPSLYAPQPIIDWPMGLWFPYRAGRHRPGITRFSSPRCRICRGMEGCLNQGWVPVLLGCGGTGVFLLLWRRSVPGTNVESWFVHTTRDHT